MAPGRSHSHSSDDPEVRRVTGLLPLIQNRDTPILRDPGFCVSERHEPIGFLNEFTQARDSDPVAIAVLDDLVRRIVHGTLLSRAMRYPTPCTAALTGSSPPPVTIVAPAFDDCHGAYLPGGFLPVTSDVNPRTSGSFWEEVCIYIHGPTCSTGPMTGHRPISTSLLTNTRLCRPRLRRGAEVKITEQGGTPILPREEPPSRLRSVARGVSVRTPAYGPMPSAGLRRAMAGWRRRGSPRIAAPFTCSSAAATRAYSRDRTLVRFQIGVWHSSERSSDNGVAVPSAPDTPQASC